MKSSKEKYEMFKNFLHNELQISREDIRTWLKECIEDEAIRLVANEFGKFNIQELLAKTTFTKDYYGSPKFQEQFKHLLIESLKEMIVVSVKK